MQKVYLFVFITLLPIAIEAEDEEFSAKSLTKLHNDERESRQMNLLTFDLSMTIKAIKKATDMLNDEIDYNKKEMNVFTNKHTTDNSQERITSQNIFDSWLGEEEYYNDQKELTERPTKILWKGTKRIGIGHATGNNKTVVIAYYDPYYDPDNEN